MDKKSGEKLCRFCGVLIDIKKSKYVLLGTYDGNKILDESYFHYNCWVKFYENKVKQKAQNIVNAMANTTMHIVEKAGVKEIIGGMLGLKKDKIIQIPEVELIFDKKKKDGKTRKKKK